MSRGSRHVESTAKVDQIPKTITRCQNGEIKLIEASTAAKEVIYAQQQFF